MKVLLDECLPIDFRRHLSAHEVHTAEWAGFKSPKNGQLLQQAERAGYEVLLTVDQGVPNQHSLVERKISVLVIRARTNQMEDLLPVVEAILAALGEIQPGQVAFAS
jgi:predicted nuclease of predicted toxin-antitoxin system